MRKYGVSEMVCQSTGRQASGDCLTQKSINKILRIKIMNTLHTRTLTDTRNIILYFKVINQIPAYNRLF